MSAEKLVADTRRALSILVGAGAAGATTDAPKTWQTLAARARAVGLSDLGERCARVATELGARGALAFVASVPLTDATLAVHDRIEALASTLMLWSVQEQLKEETTP
jgi:hypothetical protein